MMKTRKLLFPLATTLIALTLTAAILSLFRNQTAQAATEEAPVSIQPGAPSTSYDQADPALIRDINSGTGSSYPSQFVEMGGYLYFVATDDDHGRELWKSDGTYTGTAIVKDIYTGTEGSVGKLVVLTDTLFFGADDGVHGYELWKSDGTLSGTVMVADIWPGGTSSNLYWLTAYDGEVYFKASDGVFGGELWKSDGISTTLVKDINPDGGHSSPEYFAVYNGILYFRARDGIHGVEIWRSDGTGSGTFMLKDIYSGTTGSYPLNRATVSNNLLFFTAQDADHGTELWKTNGSAEGTILVRDIYTGTQGSSYNDFIDYNDILYFGAEDDVHGVELWKSDGTYTGTVMVDDINPGPDSSYAPYEVAVFEGKIYFQAYDASHGWELWMYDDTQSDAQLFKDIYPGTSDGEPYFFTVVGKAFYFVAQDEGIGYELWKSNGTSAGTYLVADINPGSADSLPEKLTLIGEDLFFSANDGSHGEELWGLDTLEHCWAKLNDEAAIFDSLQRAVDASTNVTDVVKAAGYCAGVSDYDGDSISQTLYISKSLTIQGGYTTTNWTTPDPLANPTILDALGEGRVVHITSGAAPTLDGLHIKNGYVAGNGGGVYVNGANPVIKNCSLINNTAGAGGGGLYFSGSSQAELANNYIQENQANSLGGGLHISSTTNIKLVNNIIADNQITTGDAAGVYIAAASAEFLHNTVARNQGGDGQGFYLDNTGTPATAGLTNTILVSHTVGVEVVSGASAVMTATLWGDGAWANTSDWVVAGSLLTGTVNFWGQPVFIDPDNANYHIDTGSAAIDAGDYSGITSDIDGDSRPDGSGYDIGADEFLHPLAGLQVTNDSPTELGDTTTLTATVSQGTVLNYTWDFGDGGGASGAVAAHVYPDVGIYTAVVTASNPLSSLTASTTVTITGKTIAGLVATNDSPTPIGETTTLSATVSEGSYVSFNWDFGDGETGSEATVTHIYPAEGIYTAVVTATNSVNLVTATTRVDIYQSCYARLNDGTIYPTVQQAVEASTLSTDIVKVAGYCYGVNDYGGLSQTVYIVKPLTVQGGYTTTNWITPDPDANPTILDAKGNGRVVYYHSYVGVIQGLHITGGDADGLGGDLFGRNVGGGIYVRGRVTISDCMIYDNHSNGGGGIYFDATEPIINNSEIFSNTASGTTAHFGLDDGGGVYFLQSHNASLVGNKIYDNYAESDGGGINFHYSDNPSLQSNEIYANLSDSYGGGVYLDYGDGGELVSNQVYENQAHGEAGGIYIDDMDGIQLINNQIHHNLGRSGIGMRISDSSDALIEGNQVHHNQRLNPGISGEGGGLYLDYSDRAVIIDNQFYENDPGSDGGGISIDRSDDVELSTNQVYSNTATNGKGGGISIFDSDRIKLTGNQIIANSSTNDDGGGVVILETSANPRLEGNIVRANTALYQGAGIYIRSTSDVVMVNNLIAENQILASGSSDDGAGLVLFGVNRADFIHNTIASNSGGAGSGIWLDDSTHLYMTNTMIVDHVLGINVDTGNSVTLIGTLWGDDSWANGGDYSGGGTVTRSAPELWGDPGFVNPSGGDYHINSSSDGLNAGAPTSLGEDVDGEARPFGSGPDIGFDEIASTETSVNGGGATLEATVGTMKTKVVIPSGAVAGTTTIRFTAQASLSGVGPSGFSFAGLAFDLDAYIGGVMQPGFVFSQPVTVTIEYSDADVDGLDEESLVLYYWDGDDFVDAACGVYDYHPADNWFSVPICHLSEFAVFAEPSTINKTYLPLLFKSP